ncbi:MAG TPA: hypothetical protein H9881_06935 [Candidatus Stackebrandtia excrementipullorum]|nr:hypothetical protein [Candidatus Stackebrandtia excrementipullorum]
MTAAKFLGATLGLLALGVVTACSNESEPPSITHEEATQQYFEEAQKWELAPGWEWPEDPGYAAENSGDGQGTVYGPDMGRVDANEFWFCSWASTAVSTDDKDLVAQSVEEILKYEETTGYKKSDAGAKEYTDDMLASAADGDFQTLTEYVTLNCPANPANG